MKDSKEVIQDFNKLVNMSASELETWLKSKDSGEAGWPKEDNDGETVGHESGRKITEILKSNPSKDAEKYTEDQISHMRKVVAYCKRHLAQEEQSLKNKSESEAKKTKSYISLKNWGHDPLKKSDDKNTNKGSEEVNGKSSNGNKEYEEDNGKSSNGNNENGAKSSKENKTQDKKSSNNSKEEDDEQSENEAGDKRKRQDKGGAPEPKKHRTRSGSKDEKATSNKEADDESENDDEEEEKSNSKSGKGPKPGETVSWNWGNGQPKGKVLDVKEDKATITTKRGNKVSRDGDENDPAVILDTGKSKAIKANHELN
ncbi:hypothetical protein MY1884_004864 [Beauveria asiatica]